MTYNGLTETIKQNASRLSRGLTMADTGSRHLLDCDVAVIGGGILGLATAALLSKQRGYHVVVLRLGNAGRPRADTLRNQGWLQSGLIYVGKIARLGSNRPAPDEASKNGDDRIRGRIIANQMYNAGITMLEALGFPTPTPKDYGVIRIHDDREQIGTFLDDAAQIGVADVVRELTHKELRPRLGPVFEEGRYFVIPDAPFPEGKVLEEFRRRATEGGTVFIECGEPVVLERDEGRPSGHVIVGGGRTIASRATVMAAGSGSYSLLKGIDVDPRMKLQHTPLLVVDGCHSIEVPIFADRPRGFSFARHAPNGSGFPNGALVVGTGVVDEDAPFVPYDRRSVTDDLIARFLKSLPPCFKDHVRTGRFTAGYEVVPDGVTDEDGNYRHFVEPWVEWVGAQQGVRVLLAMPGRATMGLDTADTIFDILTDPSTGIGPPSDGNRESVTGGWDGGIHMHFHPHYAGFDDRQRQREDN